MTTPPSLTSPPPPSSGAPEPDALAVHIHSAIADNGGWIGFDRFMDMALYTPRLGYYSGQANQFASLVREAQPQSQDGVNVNANADANLNPMANALQTRKISKTASGDFVTAPELSHLFGYTLAYQVAQAMQATGTRQIWEFGAGSGALALQLLEALAALGQPVERYTIVDVSASLKERQRQTLVRWGHTVHWAHSLPASMNGVVLGNEVLDAMPVRLLVRRQGVWHERGVATAPSPSVTSTTASLTWSDRPTTLRPPTEIEGEHDYLTEIHPQGEAFVATLGQRLLYGAVFLIDYGFPESEYYHPQRSMGTLMCHRLQQSDTDPLVLVGRKDITAHVNFTGIALRAQEAGLDLLGYTTQAHFLLNCGLADLMQAASIGQRAAAQKLIMEHEMGEFFKVIGWVKGSMFEARGFSHGDRSHRL